MIYYILTGILVYAILGTIQTINALPRKNKPGTVLDKLLIPGVFILLPFVILIRRFNKKILKQKMRSK